MPVEPEPQANPLLQRYDGMVQTLIPALCQVDYIHRNVDPASMTEWLRSGAASIKRATIQIDAPDDDPIRDVLNKSPILYNQERNTPSVITTVTKSESDDFYFIKIQCGPNSSINGHIVPRGFQNSEYPIFSCHFYECSNIDDSVEIGSVGNLHEGFMFNPNYLYESPIVPISLPNGWHKFFDPRTNSFFTQHDMEQQLQVLQSNTVDFTSLTSEKREDETLFEFLLRKKQKWIQASKTHHIVTNAQNEQEWAGPLSETKFTMKFRHPVNHPERLYVSIGPIQLTSPEFYTRQLSEDNRISLGGEFNLARLMLANIEKPYGYLTIQLDQKTGLFRAMMRRNDENFVDPSLRVQITESDIAKLVTNFKPGIPEAMPVKKERTVKPPPTRQQLRDKEREKWEQRRNKSRRW